MLKPLALARYPIIHSNDLDESRHFYSQHKIPVNTEKTKNKIPFEWRMNQALVGSISLAANSFQGGIRIWTESVRDFFALSFPLTTKGEALYGKTTVTLVPNQTGMIASPFQSMDFQMGLDYQSYQVSIPRRALEGALASLLGEPPKTPLYFAPMLSLSSGAGAGALRIVRFMLNEIEERDTNSLASPIVAAPFTDALLYHLLLAQPHNHTELLRPAPTPAEPRYVRQLTEYLDAHAAEPLSLSSLATLTGMSLRSLQAGLRKYRGCSIAEFLRERRLSLARKKLLCLSHSTVSQIATSCGFEHLGRFSLQYRARFGESPIETLRRHKKT